MAIKYIQAVNTGDGFITHPDQETDVISFAGAPADIWTVTCANTAKITTWTTRVSGTVMTKAAAQAAIDASLVGVTDPITNAQATFVL